MRIKAKQTLIGTIAIIIAIIVSSVGYLLVGKDTKLASKAAEEKRAMTYGELTEEDKKVEGTDYVQFSAFFTRDLNNDGYAEKVKGTCKSIGETDALYIDLNVLTKGYLTDGKIAINGENFELETTIVEDSVIKGNYIGKTSTITLQDKVMNGTQRTIWGDISQKLNSNINNYSKVNSITLTGNHVIENDDETKTITHIEKTVPLTVDWYGKTDTSVIASVETNNINTLIRDGKPTIGFSFKVDENDEQLLLQKQVAEITIPTLNGYNPETESVKVLDSGVTYNYDETNRKLTITRESQVDENGRITRSVARRCTYNVQFRYPSDSYDPEEEDLVRMTIPIKAYNYGYNNPNEEFTNPHVSSDTDDKVVLYKTIENAGYVWKVDTKVGEYTYNKDTNRRYNSISKEYPTNIYNGNENGDAKDTYTVMWKADIGTYTDIESIVLEEQKENEKNKSDKFNGSQSMYNYIKTSGIYFDEAVNLLGNDGWIKLYDGEDGELIKTFTANELKNYKEESPYAANLKSIKIETSKPIRNSNIYVYQIKEIDDKLLTTDYTEDEFKTLTDVETYLKGTAKLTNNTEAVLNRSNYALYSMPYSYSYMAVSPTEIINQETKRVDITIKTQTSNILETKWKNGVFLVELPEEIIKLNVNSVESTNENVRIADYYSYKEGNKYFIKISTENDEQELFDIKINADITANPLLSTTETTVKLYSYNEYCDNYGEKSDDFYDVDNDTLTDDKVGYDYRTIALTSVGAAGMLTTEYVTDYDDNESTTIAPNIADIEKSDNSRTAKINVSITSNYDRTLSEIAILGKIPFEGNTYVINSNEGLGSRFTTNLTGPISVPEGLEDYVTIYYSEQEKPSKDLTDSNNGWTKNVTDWTKIKSYLIDLGDYVLQNKENKIFTYEVTVPGGLGYNSASFSHHAVYYCLDTENGKLEVSTEPNKVGIQIVGKYKINLLKNRKNNNNSFVEGATFSITTTDPDGKEITQIAKTNAEGQLQLANVYIEKEYTLKEISAPKNYVILKDEIKFKLQIGANNQATFNVIEGNFKETPTIELDNKGNYVVNTKLEDEPKYNLQITKNKVNDNTLFVKNAKYEAKTVDGGEDISVFGVTNGNGIANIEGLLVNKEYTLKEISVGSDYEVSNEKIKFIGRLNSTGNIEFEVTSQTGFKNTPNLVVENGIDVVKVNLEDEAKYTLHINKKGENNTPLSGVKFTLTGNNETRIEKTDSEGNIDISGLKLGATYELEETKSVGYYLFEEPKTFKAERDNNGDIKIQSEDTEFANAVITETAGVPQANVTVNIQNEKIPTYTLQIVKVEENSNETDLSRLTKLENAKFRVTSADTEEEKEYTTDENGIIEIPGLYQYVEGKTGITAKYTIQELEAPNGYSNNAEEVNIVVKKTSNDGLDAEIEDKENLLTYKNVIVEGNKVILVLQDKPLFRLKKVDSETGLPLANAEFIIFEVDSTGKELDYGKDTNGNYVGIMNQYGDYTVKTDANGVISLPLRNGTYKAVEITYPDGYQELGTEEFFKIEESTGTTQTNTEENNDIPASIYQDEEIDESQYTIYEIDSIDDLVELSSNVNSGNDYANYIVKLTKDLDFNDDTCYEDISIKPQLIKGEETTGFTPIGGWYNSNYRTFNGIFDGQNHTISNLYIKSDVNYVGLFGLIKNAKILNLNVSGEANKVSTEGSGNQVTAGIVGITFSLNNNATCKALIKNCTSNINVNAEEVSSTTVGGIVAYAEIPTVIVNCTNSGEIKGKYYAGGIIGENSGSCPIKIINCKNEGKVSGEYYVGGISGILYANSIVYNCSNSGEITSTYTGGNVSVSAGGILGRNPNGGTVVKCSNTGKISSNGDAGGIIGYLNSTPSNPISKCYNSGEIVVEGSSTKRAGGIVGVTYAACSINNCYNSGKISSDGGYIYAGGILGHGSSNIIIDNCYNTGDISCRGDHVYISGIFGYGASQRAQISNCYNTGNISSTAIRTGASGYTYVAGIAGGSASAEIRNCYNTGNIEGTNGIFYENYAGGIFAGYGGLTIEDCYNTGEINILGEGYIYAGGIAGQRSSTSSTINRCYNVADITGINTDNTHYEYVEIFGIGGRNVNNCYNTGDVYGKLGSSSGSVQIYVGGICGGKPTNSYSTGNVSSTARETPENGTNAGTLNSSYASNLQEPVNSYYLDSILVVGDNITRKGEAVSKEYMKSEEFYNRLNTDGVWVYRNNKYPVLTKTISGTIVPSTEISINNTIKTFKITTEVKNDVGGDISGKSQPVYETVAYNENSTKDIVMTPSTGYGITSITINGEEIPFKLNNDSDTYTIPGGYFTNMKEDKHVVVAYAPLDQMFTIEKVDETDNTKLEGAKFIVKDYLEEWAENKLGNLTPNGANTVVIDRENEISGVVGSIQNNGTEYTFDTVQVTPEEGTPYNTYESNNVGVTNSTAHSYFPIDLTDKEGTYEIAVEAKVSCYNSCFGYATITETIDDVEPNVTEGRFINITGKTGSSANENEYVYELEGNKKYYLHIGYKKDGSQINADDKLTVSSIKVYGTKQASYSFEEVDGRYVSTNQNVPDSTANSYIPIDLTDAIGTYRVTVNAQLSSAAAGDYGYANITNSTEAPATNTYSGRFIYISGNKEATDYTAKLTGGQMYYLHFGYSKNGYVSENDDTFTINSVNLSMEKEDNYYEEVITNEDGVAKIGVPSDRSLYIFETEAPEGYTKLDNYTLAQSSDGSVTIKNKKKAGLTVHHYLKGTTNKVALDEKYIGDIGEKYTTSPRIDLDKLTLKKDGEGKAVIPTNASGTYDDSTIEVIYEYEVVPITLTIHHYLDGTEDKLVEDEVVETETTIEFTGEAEYTVTTDGNYRLATNSNYNTLARSYNLTSTESTVQDETSIEDTLEYNENSELSYYYETKEYEYSVHYFFDGVEDEDKVEKVTLNEAAQIEEYIDKNEDGYRLDRVKALNSEGTEVDLPLQITDNTETNVINVYYVKNNYGYEVHYFYDNEEDTDKKESYIAYVGTQVNTYKDKRLYGYELDKVEVPNNQNKELPLVVGQDLTKNIINVYYVRKDTSVLVHHYIDGTTTKVPSKTEGLLVADELKEGKALDNYETTVSNNVSDKYRVVESKLPRNANGVMAEEQIVVIYYYELKDAEVNVKYLEKGTNDVLATQEKIEGKVDDNYETVKKTVTNYTYVEDTGNTQGQMTVEPIEVIYYYLQNTSAKVQYIDKTTNEVIEEDSETGLVGDIFETVAKDFDDYILVEEPEEKNVPMEKEEIVLKYYYIHVAGGVIEKHIDVITDGILYNELHEGREGDDYEILSKEFEGYDLVENRVPTNSKGKMTVEPIEVKYYYIRKARVEVEYVDKLTGEKLEEDETIEGHENDPYQTEEKEIENYSLVEVPENAKGTMEVKAVEKEDGTIEIDNVTKVTYYYIHKSAGVVERHIDVTTNELLEEETRHEGNVGDEYKTKVKEFENYDVVESKLPENAEGEMELEEIVVEYYYIKKSTVTVKYVDKETGKELIEEIKIEGHIGDEYKTKPEEIKGYKLVTDELPGNIKGNMTEEPIEVIYYYEKEEEKENPKEDENPDEEKKEDDSKEESKEENKEDNSKEENKQEDKDTNKSETSENKTDNKNTGNTENKGTTENKNNEIKVVEETIYENTDKENNPYTGDNIIITAMTFMLSIVLIVFAKLISKD